ncbi:hypothetical protein UlMin_029087 [Ulmus minor]
MLCSTIMELQTPNNGENPDKYPKQNLPNPNNGEKHDAHEFQLTFEDFDSNCSTPYVSAPSSPGRGPVSGFFYSAPASPMHYVLATSSVVSDESSVPMGFEFEFSARFGSAGVSATGPMSSADELFLNGQIRPMKLSSHLERPQPPLLDLDIENGDEEVELAFEAVRGRDLRMRDKSLRRRTRSMSPLRNVPFDWVETKKIEEGNDEEGDLGNKSKNEEEPTSSDTTPSSSRSSSAGRNSKRWVFLKDFLYRSKSEGRSKNKFWSNISFVPTKEKKPITQNVSSIPIPPIEGSETPKEKAKKKKPVTGKPKNGVGKRRVPPSPHELHYTKNRAQAEEMRKKTYLPYRQGLLGCLGFSSKGYGAMNGFARALNPVSSR